MKVNVDEDPELAARFGVASIPTILLFRAGSPVAGTVGARGKKQLENALGLAPVERPAGERTGGRRGLLSRFGRGGS